MRWMAVSPRLLLTLRLALLLLAVLAAGGDAEPIVVEAQADAARHEPDHAASLGFATAALRAVVLTPHLRDASAFSMALRLGAAQEAAAVLLAESTLERLLDDANVAGTLERLLAAAGSGAGPTAGAHGAARAPAPRDAAAPSYGADGGAATDGSRGLVARNTTTALATEHDLLPRRLQDVPSASYAYMGCFFDHLGCDWMGEACHDERDMNNAANTSIRFESPQQVKADCGTACAGFRYMGLQWTTQCFCANHYGSQGPSPRADHNGIQDSDECGENGQWCGDGDATTSCGSVNAVWDLTPLVPAPERPACSPPAESYPFQGVSTNYRCEVPGCMDSVFPNYSPVASMDDGSCRCGHDHCGDTATLLTAFQVDLVGRGAWGGLTGWNATTDLCDWEGVSCGPGGRVKGVDLSGKTHLRFTLGETLSDLTLETVFVPNTGLSGTLPESLRGTPLQCMPACLLCTRAVTFCASLRVPSVHVLV